MRGLSKKKRRTWSRALKAAASLGLERVYVVNALAWASGGLTPPASATYCTVTSHAQGSLSPVTSHGGGGLVAAVSIPTATSNAQGSLSPVTSHGGGHCHQSQATEGVTATSHKPRSEGLGGCRYSALALQKKGESDSPPPKTSGGTRFLPPQRQPAREQAKGTVPPPEAYRPPPTRSKHPARRKCQPGAQSKDEGQRSSQPRSERIDIARTEASARAPGSNSGRRPQGCPCVWHSPAHSPCRARA